MESLYFLNNGKIQLQQMINFKYKGAQLAYRKRTTDTKYPSTDSKRLHHLQRCQEGKGWGDWFGTTMTNNGGDGTPVTRVQSASTVK